MKKILYVLSTVLILTVLVIGLTISTSAEVVGGECGADGDNVTWSFDTTTFTLTISGEGKMETYERYDYLSNKVSPWRNSYEDLIVNVLIEEGVTNIGSCAFYCCSSLMSITIPDSVTCIESYAFYDCDGLTGIAIPDSITSIGASAFNNCGNLTNITIPDSVTSIEDRTFSDCISLTSVTIPDSVTSIGDYAFRGCDLTSIEIPNSVTTIGSSAFYLCGNLMSVALPNALTMVEESCFDYCYNLQTVYIPSTVIMIKGDAFDDTLLKTVIYCGTEAQWNAVVKVTNWDGGNNPKVQYHDYALDSVGENLYNSVCIYCGAIDPASHFFGSGVVTKEPTHTSEGEKTYTCTKCGETKTETIAKTPQHFYGDWLIYSQKYHKRTCICGDVQYQEHGYSSEDDEDCNVCGLIIDMTTDTNAPSTNAPSTSEPITKIEYVYVTPEDSGCDSTVTVDAGIMLLLTLGAGVLVKKKEN